MLPVIPKARTVSAVERHRLRRGMGGGHRLGCDLGRLLGRLLVAPGDGQQQDRGEQRKHPDPEVQHEGDRQIERRPRRIEQGNDNRAGDGLANGVEVAHRLDAALGISRHRPLQDLRSEQCVQSRPARTSRRLRIASSALSVIKAIASASVM